MDNDLHIKCLDELKKKVIEFMADEDALQVLSSDKSTRQLWLAEMLSHYFQIKDPPILVIVLPNVKQCLYWKRQVQAWLKSFKEKDLRYSLLPAINFWGQEYFRNHESLRVQRAQAVSLLERRQPACIITTLAGLLQRNIL